MEMDSFEVLWTELACLRVNHNELQEQLLRFSDIGKVMAKRVVATEAFVASLVRRIEKLETDNENKS